MGTEGVSHCSADGCRSHTVRVTKQGVTTQLPAGAHLHASPLLTVHWQTEVPAGRPRVVPLQVLPWAHLQLPLSSRAATPWCPWLQGELHG